ncbi:MAG: ABC-F family ATP-binding cassette domain-containing protein [Pseudomonadota bacterium]
MSLVDVIDLSISFPERSLFHKIGFQVKQGERIGLVGRNGAGKTTLLRLLYGEISPDVGEIRTGEGIRIGYLPQDVYETLSGPLLQSLLDAVPDRNRLSKEIREAERSLQGYGQGLEQERLAARLAELHQELSDLDRAFPPHNAEKILLGLGFKTGDFHASFASLSGGWKMRAVLGSILYQSPDLLLLDEPTNHLDIPSIRWLEGFLQEYKGAMILICHDRDFLNRQISRVISFEMEGVRQYSGNYDFYLKAREEERRSLEARARNQEQKVKEAKRFIERFKAKASKARQAQSKIKLVKKMDLIKTHQKERNIRFSFPQVPPSGRAVLSLEGVSKGFNNHRLYEDLDMTVLKGERVAIIGPNGAGKTTLLRMVAGELKPDQGRIVLGYGVSLRYYAQHHSEALHPENTILEEVYQVVPHENISFIRGVCGAFLFSGKEVEKKIGVLSGGERARVCLAKILVNPGNLLVMDEPSNHLDLLSSEILIDALADYKGTLLFVSHNQSFINRLAGKILDIRAGQIMEYPGKLYEYYDHLARIQNGPPGESQPVRLSGDEGTDVVSKERQSSKLKRKERAERRQILRDALKPIQDALSRMEDRIAKLEKKQKELEKILADSEIFRDKNRSVPLLNEYREVKTKLEELILRWEHKHNELESAEKELDVN